MSALTTLAKAETRLFLRDPVTLLVAVLLPAVILGGLGAVPALRDPLPIFGGQTFVAYFAPPLLAISIVQLGLQTLPSGLATYRERGVLRRFSTTPVRPVLVLVVQLLVNLVTTVLATALLMAVALFVFGVPAPRHPVGFVASLLLGMAAAFGVGLLIAAVAPRARTAAGIGALAFMLTLFFAGVYLPNFLLPEFVVRIGAFVPPGIASLQAAWTGDGADPLVLVVMALIAAGCTGLAAKLFRWE
jgi:ABC-2 type transport system permease protein